MYCWCFPSYMYISSKLFKCSFFVAKKVSAVERQLKKEEEILEIVAEKKALMGVSELAKGIQYSDPIKTR